MNRELKHKWVTALRSGKYTQIRGELRSPDGVCCLGVLCDVIDPNGWGKNTVTPTLLGHRIASEGYKCFPAKQKEAVLDRFIDLNDVDKLSFSEIADYIEKNL